MKTFIIQYQSSVNPTLAKWANLTDKDGFNIEFLSLENAQHVAQMKWQLGGCLVQIKDSTGKIHEVIPPNITESPKSKSIAGTIVENINKIIHQNTRTNHLHHIDSPECKAAVEKYIAHVLASTIIMTAANQAVHATQPYKKD